MQHCLTRCDCHNAFQTLICLTLSEVLVTQDGEEPVCSVSWETLLWSSQIWSTLSERCWLQYLQHGAECLVVQGSLTWWVMCRFTSPRFRSASCFIFCRSHTVYTVSIYFYLLYIGSLGILVGSNQVVKAGSYLDSLFWLLKSVPELVGWRRFPIPFAFHIPFDIF